VARNYIFSQEPVLKREIPALTPADLFVKINMKIRLRCGNNNKSVNQDYNILFLCFASIRTTKKNNIDEGIVPILIIVVISYSRFYVAITMISTTSGKKKKF
jgi:hypothetical protein